METGVNALPFLIIGLIFLTGALPTVKRCKPLIFVIPLLGVSGIHR